MGYKQGKLYGTISCSSEIGPNISATQAVIELRSGVEVPTPKTMPFTTQTPEDAAEESRICGCPYKSSVPYLG